MLGVVLVVLVVVFGVNLGSCLLSWVLLLFSDGGGGERDIGGER